MAAEGVNTSILDCLNQDCWRAVLDYVPVQDIRHSESVSRRWQEVVLAYLRSIKFDVQHPDFPYNEVRRNVYRLILKPDHCSAFYSWATKRGLSVEATYCITEDNLKIVQECCPNLEAATFINLTKDTLQMASQNERYKYLRRVVFIACHASDDSISQLISNNTIEELEINFNKPLTGKFLVSIKSNTFKSLIIKQCHRLDYRHFQAFSLLSKVKKFQLIDGPKEMYNEMYSLLSRMEDLECLYSYVNYEFENKSSGFFESVSRLSRLKYLYVNTNIVSDRDLDTVTSHCQELLVLWLERCNYVTRQGVAAICRHAGPRLIGLALYYSEHLTNDDAVLIVRSCPSLKSLDLYGCLRLSPAVLPRAAAARRRLEPLRLRTADVYDNDDDDEATTAEQLQLLTSRYAPVPESRPATATAPVLAPAAVPMPVSAPASETATGTVGGAARNTKQPPAVHVAASNSVPGTSKSTSTDGAGPSRKEERRGKRAT